jgi:hypothetical protein
MRQWAPLVRDVLREQGAETGAAFMTIPGVLAIVWALLSDRVPLFGLRREGYLFLGLLLTVLAWLAAPFVPSAVTPVVALGIVLNLGNAVAVVAGRGALAEEAQRRGITGWAAVALSTIIEWPSYLWRPLHAHLHTPAAVGAVCVVASLAVIVALALSSRGQPAQPGWTALALPTFVAPPQRLLTFLGSRAFWSIALLVFCQEASGLPSRLLGGEMPEGAALPDVVVSHAAWLSPVSVALAGVAYAFLCRRLPLRVLLPNCMLARALTDIAFASLPRSTGLALDAALLATAAAGILAGIAVLHVALRALPRGNQATAYILTLSVPTSLAFAGLPPLFLQRPQFQSAVGVAAAAAFWGALVAAFFVPRHLVDRPDGSTD